MTQQQNPDWNGKYPIVGLKIDTSFNRTPEEKARRFHDFSVPDISDWVGLMYTMDGLLRPGYTPMRKLVGPAFTVKMPPGDNLMLKKAITLAEPGDVLVVDARGHASYCCGGAEMMLIAKKRGVAGMVLDGFYRDLNQMKSFDFPIFCRGVHPATGPKRGPGEIGVPVSCGGVVVHAGDVIVADEDGICCIPQDDVGAVIEKCGTVREWKVEDDWPTVVEDNRKKDEYYDSVLASRGVKIIK
ncbi:RraA family protein [Pseudochelatococcus sp. B33]